MICLIWEILNIQKKIFSKNDEKFSNCEVEILTNSKNEDKMNKNNGIDPRNIIKGRKRND